MDYEIKYVIAIFFIVKIAALSPEFPISKEKEKPEQSRGLLETPFWQAEDEDNRYRPFLEERINRERHFDGELGNDISVQMKMYNGNDVRELKKIKENPNFDTCEHKIELLENSPKWRNIQKTLRWFGRMLSTNQSMNLCEKRKRKNQNLNFENYFHQRKSKKMKNFIYKNKTKAEEKLKNKKLSKKREKKILKRKRKYKHKSWRNRSKKGNKKFRFLQMNDTRILKPNSDLLNFERLYLKRSKSKNIQNENCTSLNSNSKSLEMGTGRSCEEIGDSKKEMENLSPTPSPEVWSGERGDRAEGGHDPDNRLQQQKTKAWPHFVYHRVSSNFLHPEPKGHNHRQSAYIAISVATSTKPETTDNNS